MLCQFEGVQWREDELCRLHSDQISDLGVMISYVRVQTAFFPSAVSIGEEQATPAGGPWLALARCPQAEKERVAVAEACGWSIRVTPRGVGHVSERRDKQNKTKGRDKQKTIQKKRREKKKKTEGINFEGPFVTSGMKRKS